MFDFLFSLRDEMSKEYRNSEKTALVQVSASSEKISGKYNYLFIPQLGSIAKK